MKNDRSPALPAPSRRQAVDLLRGIAIALMIAYHFCFDLDYFGTIRADMNNAPFWLGARTAIVTLFLGTMGTSLYLATAQQVRWRPYLRHLGLLAGAAALVSLSSWFMFPRSWIFFGVLHFIALASVLALPLVRLYWSNLVAGITLVAMGIWFSNPFFDQPTWRWFGLMTHKPIAEDYVPLLPWFGVVLIGIFIGRAIYGQERAPAFATRESKSAAAKLLALAGRHGLLIYLTHQPLMLAVLWLAIGR